uniref:RNA-dependent RNA polymerase n=1 Tax=Soybean thrips sobemo-like virus 8 TaxID=2801038 RepID=A0A7T8E832_9VIRU|nr:RNA-dependent RNA polymerase [Soybean thrips sobemo-like virus 8]
MREPTGAEYERVVATAMLNNSVRFRRPWLPGESGFDAYYSRCLRLLDPTSSAGPGYFSKYGTIGAALGHDGLRFTKVPRLAKLKELVTSRLSALANRVSDLDRPYPRATNWVDKESPKYVGITTAEETGSTDPIRVFIKDEPHSLKKIEEGRFRLIWTLSLVDRMVDLILFYPWSQVEVRNPMEVTAKAGWAPIPAGFSRMVDEFPQSESVAVDKSSWDWTMPAWVISAYVDVKKYQCHGWDELYDRYVWNRLVEVLGPQASVVLPDGTVWAQNSWGIMKSGWFLTLSLNSMAQEFQHVLACFRLGIEPPPVWAMGDDILTRFKEVPPGYEGALESTGCVVKKVERSREFAGYDVVGDDVATIVVNPLYPDKHRHVLRHTPDGEIDDLLTCYCCMYALSDDRWFEKYYDQTGVRVELVHSMWAKGLVELKCIRRLPAWLSEE